MKLRDVGLSFLGGSVIYVTMAACATQPGKPLGGGGRGAGGGAVTQEGHGGGGHGGQGGNGGHGLGFTTVDSGFVDVITNPVGTASADPAPGSRLKPKFWTGEDGAKQYQVGSWFDAERGEDCSLMLAADGKTRCLPHAVDFGYYADAACTKPMVMTQGACTAPKYGISVSDSSCGLEPGAVHVYAVGAAMTPSNIYAKQGAGCFSLGAASAEYSYYTVGAEVPASAFVAVTLGHD